MKTRLLSLILFAFASLAFGAKALAADVVLTPFGQSPDAMMVKVVLKKLGVEAGLEKALTADDLTIQKVLVAVVAGSSKGLGAAGTDKDAEVARMQALADAAKSAGIHVLVMHIGGKGRRGTLTDQFIAEAVPMAEKLIVVEGGDFDGLFTTLAGEAGLEIMHAPSIREVSEPLQQVLTEWGIVE